MHLGRVPVILSDEWVPPEGPAWARFSVRLAERRVAEIPRLLEARREEAAAMGRVAREEYLRWFASDTFLRTLVTQLDELRWLRDHDERERQKAWQTRSFYWGNLGTPGERLRKKLKEGTVVRSLVNRAVRRWRGIEIVED